jgi:hypothetical protein
MQETCVLKSDFRITVEWVTLVKQVMLPQIRGTKQAYNSGVFYYISHADSTQWLIKRQLPVLSLSSAEENTENLQSLVIVSLGIMFKWLVLVSPFLLSSSNSVL